jgi:putative membrane protein
MSEVMFMMFPGYADGYMAWMMIGSVVFSVALIALAVFAIVRLSPGREGNDAVAILKQRLARGEINAEEYQSRRSLILGH